MNMIVEFGRALASGEYVRKAPSEGATVPLKLYETSLAILSAS